MRLPDGVRRRFRLPGQRGDVARDVDDELSHHFEEAVAAAMRQGLDREEAAARARDRFGDARAYRNALMTIDARRVEVSERRDGLDGIARTVAFVARRLRRSPWLTASVVSILGLGIGANAVMFGVVDRLLLSPPQHVVDPDQVHILHVRRVGFNGDVFVGRTVTYPDFQDFAGLSSFKEVGAFTGPVPLTVGRGEAADQAQVNGVSAGFFSVLGVQPEAGRFFTAREDRIEAEPTAVLSHEYWTRAFGADPSVLGSTIDVGRGTYTVVGIAPPGFTGAELEPVDIWIPITLFGRLENGEGWRDNRGWYWLQTVARTRPEVTVEAAAAEATAAHRSGRAEQIATNSYDANAEVLVAPIIAARGPRPSEEARVARWLGGVSLIVLLIACFNVANLLLARSVQGRREIAVRLALGVSRRRLLTEVLGESLALAGLGALAAVVVARFLGSALHEALLPGVAFTDAGLGGRLLAFTAVATLCSGVLTGVLPALAATRTELAETLRAGGRSVAGERSRTRLALLVGQAALSVVLLVGAGLFVRSLSRAQALDLGFDAQGLAVVSLEWNETLPGEEREAIYEETLDRLNRLPDVSSAALTYTVPFRSSISLGQPRVPGLDSIPRHHNGGPYVNKVGSGYFETMGLTIVEGRGIEPIDDARGAAPVAVVSRSMASAVWPRGDVLGACMILGEEEDAACTEVVGVVEDHRRQDLVEDDPHFLYYVNRSNPAFQGPPQAIMARLRGEPRSGLASLRREAREASGQIRFVGAASMTDYIAPQLRSWRLGASMFTVFGILALIVAAWGLYSVLAFDVALRRHEIGVRCALGADRGRIVRLVLRQALVLVAIGTALGLLVAGGASRFIEPLLFRVSGTDPWTYGAVAACLMIVAGVAGALPAWRATRVDPKTALQAD